MVEGPAVGKAGNFLDWIAGGLEMNEVKDLSVSHPSFIFRYVLTLRVNIAS